MLRGIAPTTTNEGERAPPLGRFPATCEKEIPKLTIFNPPSLPEEGLGRLG
jgi:hypothetical protein